MKIAKEADQLKEKLRTIDSRYLIEQDVKR